jgi:AP-2 complex subunit alpha
VKSLHETIVKIGAYVLSEFGNLIAEQDGKTHEDQFQLLEMHFPNVSNQTKAMLMTTFMKMVKNCPQLEMRAVTIMTQY